jgi:ABC-2 type transport system permease protein
MGLQYLARALCLALILVSIAYITSHANARADLTAEHVYSLSPTTREVLAKIPPEHPVRVQAFVSTDVPRDYAPVRTRLTGLLRQYAQLAGAKMDVQYVDVEPFSHEADEAKHLGIMPQRIRSEREGRHYEDTVYLGAVISSSYDQVVIPFFGAGMPLEYELTRSIRTVANETRRTVGVLKTDADIIGGSHDWQIITELKQQYNVKEVSPDSPIEDGKYDVLLAVMPSSLTEPQMKNLVDYVKKGRPTLIFDDPFPWIFNSSFGVTQAPKLPKPSPGGQFGMSMQRPAPPKADDGRATSLTKALHIFWDNGRVVWDTFNPHPEYAMLPEEFIFLSPRNGTRGAFSPQSEITSGLQEMLLAFSGEIQPLKEPGVKFEPLLRTSPRSGVMEWEDYTEQGMDFTHGFTPTARIKDNRPHFFDKGGHVVAAHLTSESDNPYKLNVVYVADVDLISDWFFVTRNLGEINLSFDNVPFVLNAVDVLAGDRTFVDLRKRRSELRTLTGVEERTSKFVEEREQTTKQADEEAKQRLTDARKRFKDKREEIEKDSKLGEAEKEQLIRILQEGEQRRLDVQKANIDRDKQQKIDDAKNSADRRIRETEHKIMFQAVLLPPIPAIVLGLVVFLLRLGREHRTISPERRAND